MNLKELATELGLSPTTVSRALNGYPEVNAQTRLKVAEAASRYNYRPNMRARSLATGRAMAIGHVIPMSTTHEIVNPVFADFIAGAGESYACAGYDMVLSVVKDSDEARIYRDMQARGTVDGVILHAPVLDDPRLPLLAEIGLPFVVHGRSAGARVPYSWVDVNNDQAFRRATDLLLDLGHRRIALVNGLGFMDFAIRRQAGYLDALAARGIAPEPGLVHSEEMTEGAGYRAARAMLALPDPPTALLAASMISAIGIRRAAEERGMKLGQDLALVAHDDELSYLRNGEEVPIFTATRSSVRAAGRQAADMLIRRIADPDLPVEQHLMEADLVLGQSTGPWRTPARRGQP